ncbi:hypothetical protein HZ326_6322 [Fusarium oxysporum f. sp. albedinis]|nr:hypothetical protein HZ326_6322 [Fusarium oxysporum f. sp. albedinis]
MPGLAASPTSKVLLSVVWFFSPSGACLLSDSLVQVVLPYPLVRLSYWASSTVFGVLEAQGVEGAVTSAGGVGGSKPGSSKTSPDIIFGNSSSVGGVEGGKELGLGNVVYRASD